MNNFRIELLIDRPKWPFKWGPFGGLKSITIPCTSGDLRVFQRENGAMARDPLTVDLHVSSQRITTTVSFNNRDRLKRHTFR